MTKLPRRQYICPRRHSKTSTSSLVAPFLPRTPRWGPVRSSPMISPAQIPERQNARATGRGYHPRVEVPRTTRQYRRFRRFGPVHQVGGVRQSCLIRFFSGRSQEIHPVLAINFFWNDRTRLRPGHVPVSFLRRQDHTFSLPVAQILRGRQAQLGVLLVVARVGQVIRAVDLYQPWVLYTSVFFV